MIDDMQKAQISKQSTLLHARPIMFVMSTETFRWPKGAVLRFYRESEVLFFSTRNRNTDLFDTLTLNWPIRHRTVFFGLTCPQHAKSYWSEELLAFTEGRIKYDFEFDCCKVKPIRITSQVGSKDLSCAKEFRWKLLITNSFLLS